MPNLLRPFRRTVLTLSSSTIIWMVRTWLLLTYSSLVTKVTGACVSNCVGVQNGNYQHCNTCTMFITCSNNILYEMPCPAGTEFDDVIKQCTGTSTTCPEPTTTTITALTTRPTTADTTENIVQHTTEEAMASSTELVNPKPDIRGKNLALLWYRKTQIASMECPSTNSSGSPFGTRKVRSRIECGTMCNVDIRCLYFQVKNSLCFMYETASPPCTVDIYKYDG